MLTFKDHRFLRRPVRFLFPSEAGVFPFDAAAKALIDELRRVGWEAPGIDVKVRTCGSERMPLRHVSEISGETVDGPFRIRFGRAQGQIAEERPDGSIERWSHPTGVSELNLPIRGGARRLQIHLEVWNPGDGSPTLYRYVGDDWSRDADRFMNGFKCNAKLNKEPRTYLKYKAEGHGASARFVSDTDLGREYAPEGNEQRSFPAAMVFDACREFLRDAVRRLSVLPTRPGHDVMTVEGDANMRRMAEVEPVPAPEGFPRLYVKVDANDARTAALAAAMSDPAEPALCGNGWRLCSLGVPNDPSRPFPERAYDGFNYAFSDPECRSGIGLIGGNDDRSHPIAVDLKYLNDVFVVDEAAFHAAREAMVDIVKSQGRDRFTDREVNLWYAALARTMVPAAEYDGSYGRPIWLIGRPLGADEARPVVGKVRLVRSEDENVILIGEGDDAVVAARLQGWHRRADRIARDLAWSIHGDDKAFAVEEAEPAPASPAP